MRQRSQLKISDKSQARGREGSEAAMPFAAEGDASRVVERERERRVEITVG